MKNIDSIEAIVDKRITSAGMIEYLVKAYKYPNYQYIWTNANELKNFNHFIKDFERKRRNE
jgi:hypothetical protein